MPTACDDMAFLIEYVNGSGTGFHTVDRASGDVIGGTAFLAPDERNPRVSRSARTDEETFRRHMLVPDGTWRDSVYFSVIAPNGRRSDERLMRLLDR